MASLLPDLARALRAYDWPRNLREQRQDLIAAAVLAAGDVMRVFARERDRFRGNAT